MAIAIAAIYGVIRVSGGQSNVESTVSILTSAFTAIGTMTTAYFGIRAVSNTAQHVTETQSKMGSNTSTATTQAATATSQAQPAQPVVAPDQPDTDPNPPAAP